MGISGTRWTWVEAAQRGEASAVQGFVEKYRPAVVAYLKYRGAEEEAEDIAQEVFLTLFHGQSALARAQRGRGQLRSLIFVVASNAFVDWLRRREAEKRGGGVGHVDVQDVDLAAAQHEDVFDREWFLRLLDLALQWLEAEHPNYYRAVHDCKLQGRPQAEVAAELGCTVNDVKNYARRGKKALARYLGKEVWATTSTKEEHSAELKELARLLPGMSDEA